METIETRTVQDPSVPGLSYRVSAAYDDIGGPEDNGDCYTARQIAAFRNGDWCYAVIMVTPVIGSVRIDASTQVLGGVEYGAFTLTDEQDNYGGSVVLDLDHMTEGENAYPVPDLIEECRATLPGHVIALARQFAAVAAGLELAA